MDELISRQAVIEALDSINCFGWVEDSWKNVCGIIERIPAADTDYFKFTERLYKEAYERGKAEAQRWIPVTAELPKERCPVLVTVGNSVTVTGYVDGEWIGFISQPAAWMYAPSPWKGEE